MPFGSRIQFYILRECLSGLALVLGILLIAILMIDVVEQLRTVGGDVSLSLLGALQLSLMKLPQIMEQTLPFALLVASMMAFTRLNRRSELSIIRASGISAWRFLTPVIVLGLVVGIATTTLLNPISARLTESFEVTRAQILDKGRTAMAVSDTGVWLRQGDDTSQIVIHAQHVDQGGVVLRNVKMIEEERLYSGSQPTSDFAFARRIDAERAIELVQEVSNDLSIDFGERCVRRTIRSPGAKIEGIQLQMRAATGICRQSGLYVPEIDRPGTDTEHEMQSGNR
jgi:lipopolysaccharide export system permease protein